MKIIRTIRSLRRILSAERRSGKRIGFVPTMGYFHEGHLALMRRSAKDNAITVVSLFVNPLQFGPREDFNKYPRDLSRDARMAASAGADILFAPPVGEMYGDRPLVTVKVTELSDHLCGASRPGHFDGVVTVVAKLLNIVQPDKMYLGQKDAQQVVIIKRLVKDLECPVAVTVCPTVREPDGLAMSSRNSYLSSEERGHAPVIYRALNAGKAFARRGNRHAARIEKIVKTMIDKSSDGRIDYVTCVDAESLRPLKTLQGKVMIAAAVRFGPTRLIDNIIFKC